MAGLVFLMLLFSMAGHSSATWCVCKDGLGDGALQKTLDYACGAGADCNPIHQNGPCFNPNTVRAHCSYAVNSYFQKQKQVSTACDFSGTATVTTADPSSSSSCAYPATATSSTTTTTSPGTTTSVPGTAGGSPVMTTPGSGVLGGSNNGLGPSGFNDVSDGVRIRHSNTIFFFSSIILTFSALVFW
ncbi:hypothetical protein ACS0TY_006749 [Phlomoides rotata]